MVCMVIQGKNDYIITAWTETPPQTSPEVKNGVILAKSHPDSIELQFSPATSTNYTVNQLKYTVYYTSDPSTVMYSTCGVQYAQQLNSFYFNSTAPNSSIVFLVKGLDKDHSYRFNVMAQDPTGQTTFYNEIAATTAEEPPSDEVPYTYIFGIGIPVGILILIFIIYLLVRNRKLTKELEIEMTDMPKHAVRKAVAGPPSLKTGAVKEQQRQPYNQLLQQDEDDEEAGDYTGPVSTES